MQNFIKSQTRLAFIQFIFQSEFLSLGDKKSIDEFHKYFYNSNISVIGNKKEFKIKFNKNYFKKLCENYLDHFEKKKTINMINKLINLDRKFERWNIVLKSLIFAIISEIQNSEDKNIKIIFNDYINISKSLINLKETKLMNAIVQRYLNEKKI
tara:strand:- start:44 stop:505 length:462 start_codon:yes stop_codon:yes gene_type:complete